MARLRFIKPGFFTNDILAEVEPLGRLLFIGLWTIADREGRLEDRPKKIKAEILPYENADVDNLLHQLHARGFILRYTVNGASYISVINFTRHQNPHKNENPSIIPEPCNSDTTLIQVYEDSDTSIRQVSDKIKEDSLYNGISEDSDTTLIQVSEKNHTNRAVPVTVTGTILVPALPNSSKDLIEEPLDEKDILDRLVLAFHTKFPNHRLKYSVGGVVKCRDEFAQRLRDGWTREGIERQIQGYMKSDCPAPWEIFSEIVEPPKWGPGTPFATKGEYDNEVIERCHSSKR